MATTPLASSRQRRPLGQRYGLMAALVGVAFLPRLVMALRHSLVCTDAVFYLERAKALAGGDLEFALSRLGLNPYPWLLAGLYRLGLDWELAGTTLSLSAASLAVVPLWALTCRLFNPTVATVTALLYAVHPELIEWSPEIIRDPLFWLLFTSTLYLGHRACETLRWSDFLATGAALSLAILTRFEGWFLLAPLVGWAVLVTRRQPQSGPRIALGSVACLAVLPLLIVAINLTALRGHARWEWGRLDHVALAAHWISDWYEGNSRTSHIAGQLPATDSGREIDEARGPVASWSLRSAVWGYGHTLRRSFRHLYFFAAIVGFLLAWRRRLGRDEVPLWILAALQLVAVWIYFWQQREINARYMLPVLLVALPYAALTYVAIFDALAARWARLDRRSVRGAMTLALMLVVAAPGLSEAWSRPFEGRYVKAHLGQYLLARFGSGRRLLCSENLERMVGYYARAEHRALPEGYGGATLVSIVDDQQPDVIALWMRPPGPQRYGEVLAAHERLGYRALAPHDLPDCCDEVAVLVRHELLAADEHNAPRKIASVCDCAVHPTSASTHR